MCTEGGRQSVSWGAIFGTPVIWGTCVATFCYMYFVYFCMTWMPTYFKERFGFSLTASGWFTFMSFAGTGTIAILAGWAADRLIARGRNPVTVRKAFTIVGFVLAFSEVFGAFSHSTAITLFLAVFSLSGLGLATANYWALTQTLTPRSASARVAGIQNTAANMAGIAAPWITGLAGTKDRKFQRAADRGWFLAPGGHRLLSLSGQGEICIALGRFCSMCLLAAASFICADRSTGGEWRTYGGDLGNTRYSALDQINASNFNKLQIAWRLRTDNFGPEPEYKFEATPLMANGVLYTTAGSRRAVVALDAGDRRAAVDACGARRRTRHGGSAAAFWPRSGLLDRRQGRANSLCHAGLPADRAGCEDRYRRYPPSARTVWSICG